MRTCYLHVGTPKTGSTMIQGFLASHRRALAAKGLDVPIFPERSVESGPRVLANALRLESDPDKPVTPSWRWLDRHIATTASDLCISRESFSSEFMREKRLAFTQRFFERRGVALKIIAYVRDTPDRVNSAYTQHAKKLRMPQDFAPWLRPIRPQDNPKFSPWRVFRHVLAADDVAFTVRSFDVVRDRLLADFLSEIGFRDFDARRFDDRRFRNATPGPKAIAAGLVIARELGIRKIDPEVTRSYGAAFEAGIAARGWNERPFFGPTPETSARLCELYDAENDVFALKAWGQPWGSCVPRRAKPQNVFDPARASHQDVADVQDLARETLARGRAGSRPWARALTLVRWPFARPARVTARAP